MEEDGAERLHGSEMLTAVEGVGRKQSRPEHLGPRPLPEATPTGSQEVQIRPGTLAKANSNSLEAVGW